MTLLPEQSIFSGDGAGASGGWLEMPRRRRQVRDTLMQMDIIRAFSNNSAGMTVTPQQADLALEKIVDNTTPLVNGTITFTITLTNSGPNAATNVVVTDLLPAGLTFQSATPSQGTYNSSNGTWTVGTVISGLPQSLTITALVAGSTPSTNTASLSQADQFDPNTANNNASATVTPMTTPVRLQSFEVD
jgi:uncharacterized repeat protein (TIGR01451 family)